MATYNDDLLFHFCKVSCFINYIRLLLIMAMTPLVIWGNKHVRFFRFKFLYSVYYYYYIPCSKSNGSSVAFKISHQSSESK